jgi:hypothetical protein
MLDPVLMLTAAVLAVAARLQTTPAWEWKLALKLRVSSLSLFFPSFVRLIDVFNTLLVFSTLLSLL